MTRLGSLTKVQASRSGGSRDWCCNGCRYLKSDSRLRTEGPSGRSGEGSQGSWADDEGYRDCGQTGEKYRDVGDRRF